MGQEVQLYNVGTGSAALKCWDRKCKVKMMGQEVQC